ncbi:MAG: redoxin domain-containing protein [Planctomycetes bacterium]|nr:redoxin domain-containing protein [Planctomycetota bacterium]
MTKGLWAALLAGLLAAQDQNLGNSYLGKAPPELASEKEQWLNSEPLKLEKLRGRVVWLEFGFLKCGPCRKLKPTLARWHKDLSEKGLVVIDVSDGALDQFADLKKEVAEKEEKFPVLWDKESKICTAYGIQAYPQAYLVGVDGTVVWEGLPSGKIEAIEKLMAIEIAKVKK